ACASASPAALPTRRPGTRAGSMPPPLLNYCRGSSSARRPEMPKPIVAIVGRPNVGKSMLFNRLVGERVAIVEETPGITRDRGYGDGDWRAREFAVVDPGGIGIDGGDPFRAAIREQAEVAMEEADVILFVVDTIEGPHPIDAELADLLRRSRKPVLLVA